MGSTRKRRSSLYRDSHKWRKLYNSAAWKRLRQYRLGVDPLCKFCQERFNRITPASVCDHIIPHKGDKDLFYDFANTQSLCKECHDVHKRREELGLKERHEFGADGYPI